MKKSEMFLGTSFECSNGSEASGEEHPFVEWPEESRELNPHFFPMRKLSQVILVRRQHELLVQNIWASTITKFGSPRFQLEDAHWWKRKACKTRLSNTDELKAFVNHAWRSMKKGFFNKFSISIRACFISKGGQNNLMSLGDNISLCYKRC